MGVGRAVVSAGLCLLAGRPAQALVVGGGGSARSDCLAVFDAPANLPAGKPRHIRCADGDPCDGDGLVDGGCDFAVAVCANSTFDARCTLQGVESVVVEHAEDNGDPDFDPAFQALQSRIDNALDPLPTSDPDLCSGFTSIRVTLAGPFANDRCLTSKKKLRVVTESTPIDGRVYRDTDTMKLICDPAPAGCDPQQLFTGTFDRIQRQIFNQSCALSSCHDSESEAGNLLLEVGAAHGNLVGVTPSNGAAVAAGWKRVTVLDATSGDPATSFLLHKLTGDIDASFGERMPRGLPKLDQILIDIVELWIAAGAPETGWVPGTD
jgi:hypothetical protein